MKVGDLVHMPGSIEPITGIVLREERPSCLSHGMMDGLAGVFIQWWRK